MIIDAHSHLNDKVYDADREAVIARMFEAGVKTITVGTDLEMSRKAILIAEKYDMWATVGQHPSDNLNEVFDLTIYRKLCENPRVVAIGECGLDFHWEKTEEGRKRQIELFEKQIELAKEVGKPLMIHCREAYDYLPDFRGVIGNFHFFSGSIADAKKYLDRGFTFSFGGVITFTHDYDELVGYIPAGSLLLETDAPYVAPVPNRGKRNEPAYVTEVVKKIAEIRGISPEQVAEVTFATAKRVFALS